AHRARECAGAVRHPGRGYELGAARSLPRRAQPEGLVGHREAAAPMSTPPARRRHGGGTPRMLRELRSLRVLLIHPDDQDGQELSAQLQRIGCQLRATWPPREQLPDEVDIVFFAMRPEFMSMDLPWLRRE